jgi:hypothetical protein
MCTQKAIQAIDTRSMPIYESDVCEECAPQPDDSVFQDFNQWMDRIGLRRRAFRSVILGAFGVQTFQFHTEQMFFAPIIVPGGLRWDENQRPARESPSMEESEFVPLLAERNTLDAEEDFGGVSASPDAD